MSNLAHLEWITANLENAKLLMQHESDNKREADKLIARANGVIDVDNDKLMHALANQRCTTDGWLAWEKKHALVIGLQLEDEESLGMDSPPVKKQRRVVSPDTGASTNTSVASASALNAASSSGASNLDDDDFDNWDPEDCRDPTH